LGETNAPDTSLEHSGELFRSDGQTDARAFDGGHGNADEVSLFIDHGAAAITRVEGAVDLYGFHLALVILAETGDRALVDRDIGVALLEGQRLAEGKALDVNRHGFHEGGLALQIDGPREVPDAVHLEYRQIAAGVARHD